MVLLRTLQTFLHNLFLKLILKKKSYWYINRFQAFSYLLSLCYKLKSNSFLCTLCHLKIFLQSQELSGEPIFVKHCRNRRKNNNSNKLFNHYNYHCCYYLLLWISFAVTPVMWLAIFRHFSAFTLFYRVHNPRTDVRAENKYQSVVYG